MQKITLLTCLLSILCCLAYGSDNNADSAVFYLEKASKLSKAQKVWEADKTFQKAIAFAPGLNQARVAYGNYLISQRKYFFAVEQFGKVLENDIDHREALEKMTEISFLLRRWNDVIVYGKKLALSDTDAQTNYMLGRAYYEMENYGQAKTYLLEAKTKNAEHTEAIALLGKTLIELSDYKLAIEVYHQSIELNPSKNQLIYELGMLYFTMNNEREAVKYFELSAAKGFKKDLAYYENLGNAYLSFNVDKGVEILVKVLENKPGNEEILFQMAQAYFKSERFKEAAETFYLIFENDSNNGRALFMTGVAYQKTGDKNKGIQLCEQAIRLDPGLAQYKSTKSIF